jgi:N-acetylglutamate synthase-like GNAT family acetyltransferase
MAPRTRASEFTEKEFYLEEFHGRTLLCAVHHEGDPRALTALGDVTRELAGNGTQMVVVAGGRGATADDVRAALGTPRLMTLVPGPVTLPLLQGVWEALRAAPVLVGLCGSVAPAVLVDFARTLGERLRIPKLIVVDPGGGLRIPGTERLLSFVNAAMLARLIDPAHPAAAALAERRSTLEAIQRALAGGIEAVNLCALEGLARELFTYEGAGTLCTQGEYCRVAPLGVDDFHEVEKLLERGQREGYLKVRDRDEIAEILFAGFGATIGHGHLAGVCGLRTVPYAAYAAGEIVGLYTLTRFKGEGVGITLVEYVKTAARASGLTCLFACTTQAHVGQFFERLGFRRVTAADVPAEKWQGYGAARQRELAVYRLELG